MKTINNLLDFKHDVVVVGNGDYPSHPIPLKILNESKFVVCCDGGANEYIRKGNIPNLIIGDGDSLSKENAIRFKERIKIDSDQETNDLTKAVKYLLKNDFRDILIVGASGKREDHIIGNVSLLREYLLHGANVRMYTDYGVFIPCHNEIRFKSEKGIQISIFNVNAINFDSKGLKYPLYDFTALWQGTLNESIGEIVEITAKGEFLLFISYEKKSKEK